MESQLERPLSPDVLPVFPLTGVLLLPGSFLPLNIFESRYRSLVGDVLAGHRQIGMVQPFTPRQDNEPESWLAAESDAPPLYTVGCAGLIDQCEPQDDGRYLIVLRGLRRFRTERELPRRNGYRRVQALYDFDDDPATTDEDLDTQGVLAAVARFSAENELDFDLDLLAALPAGPLVNGLAAALPFLPGEKQALLEARTTRDRAERLLTLMGMGLELDTGESRFAPPLVH